MKTFKITFYENGMKLSSAEAQGFTLADAIKEFEKQNGCACGIHKIEEVHRPSP